MVNHTPQSLLASLLFPSSWDFDAQRLLDVVDDGGIVLSSPVFDVSDGAGLLSDHVGKFLLSPLLGSPCLADGLSASVTHSLVLDFFKSIVVNVVVEISNRASLVVQG